MKKTLYFMRHGQTMFNEKDIVQGACDSPLTELGRRQPLYAKRWFSNHGVTFDHVYASTQERASDTLEIITDLPYGRLKGIKEMHFGSFEGGPNAAMRSIGFSEDRDALVPYGGESWNAVQDRAVSTLTEIMDKDDHETVLAVSHGCTMFAFTHKWLPDVTWETVKLSNCCILKFEYENGVFTFIEAIEHDFYQPLN